MILQSPFHVLTPTVDGDVLGVLARPAAGGFTLAEISRLVPSRSYQGLQNAADRLAAQGIVFVDLVGRSRVYTFNREHLLADAVVRVATARASLVERLRGECEPMALRYAALFGSAARNEMRPDSDIDLLFVALSDDEETIMGAVMDLCDRATRWTGNTVNPIVLTEANIDAGNVFSSEVAKDAVTLAGDPAWLRRQARKAAA